MEICLTVPLNGTEASRSRELMIQASLLDGLFRATGKDSRKAVPRSRKL